MARGRLALPSVLAVGLVTRLVGFGWGVPQVGRTYSVNTDERTTLRLLAKTNPRKLDFDLREYSNPAFFYYQCGAAFALASLSGYVPVARDRAFYHRFPEYDARLHYVGRAISLIYGIATIGVVYLIGVRIGNAKIGLIAATALAFSPSHIVHSRGMTNEVSQAFWLALSLLFALKAMRRPTTGNFVWLGVTLGLALSTKLTALPFLLLPAAAYLLRARELAEPFWAKAWRPIVSGLIVALVFAAINPYMIRWMFFAPPAEKEGVFIASLVAGFSLARTPATLLDAVIPREIFFGMGPLALVLAIVAVVDLVRRHDRFDLLLLSVIAPAVVMYNYYAGASIERRMIPLFLLVAVLIGRTFGGLLGSERWRSVGRWGVGAFVVGSVVYGSLVIARFLQPNQTRLAYEWCRANLADSTTIGFLPNTPSDIKYAYWVGPEYIGCDYIIESGEPSHAGLPRLTPYRLVIPKDMDELLARAPEIIITTWTFNGTPPEKPLLDSRLYRVLKVIHQPRPGLEWVKPRTLEGNLFQHYPIYILARADSRWFSS